jgi:hypothetical protein
MHSHLFDYLMVGPRQIIAWQAFSSNPGLPEALWLSFSLKNPSIIGMAYPAVRGSANLAVNEVLGRAPMEAVFRKYKSKNKGKKRAIRP